MKTILSELRSLPPCACRLLARRRRGRKAMTDRDLAYISGLNRATISRLSMKDSWNDVPVGTAVRFALACGVNHLARRRHIEILKTGNLTHVLTAPPRQKRYLLDLAKLVARVIS